MATIAAAPVHRTHGPIARAVPLTFLLGATVVISWVGIRGTGIINGPGRWLHETWFLVWAVQALLVIGLVLAVEWLRPSATRRAMLIMVIAAWFGELIAAAVLASTLVGELDVVHAPYVWLVGTGFGIQPAAAIIGGILAHRRRPHAATPLG